MDYFHDAEALVAQAFSADRSSLEKAGFVVAVALSQPGFVRAIVGRGGDETKVEWAHDSAWRFLPPVADPLVGFRLHPLDLAINKVLALAGRDEPRDFLDVIYVHRNYLAFGGLCWAAVGKDPGFSPAMLVEMLARKGRYHSDDFSALRLSAKPDIAELKHTWLDAVSQARRLVNDLPSGDAGCLYWNPATGKFETPASGVGGLVRHFACRGGILPSIGEEAPLESDNAAKSLLAGAGAPGQAQSNPEPTGRRV